MKTFLLPSIAILTTALIPQITPAQDHDQSISKNQSITVKVDGDAIEFENQQPMLRGDRVMIPLRGTLEKLGITVKWDPDNQTVFASKGKDHVVLRIGDIIAHRNGEQFELHVPALIMRGSTMVPLRFVSQSFGAKVDWNENTRTVDITSGGSQDN